MVNRGERGAALVEFAIVLPLLLLLVFGIIESGVLIYDKAMLTNASREGTRVGIVYVPDGVVPAATIQQVVTSYCDQKMITFDPVKPAVTVQTVYSNDPVTVTNWLTVTVLYDYQFLLVPILLGDLFNYVMPGGYQLSAVTTMRMEL
jgi:Flp pilus assembly protein TadG